MVTRGQLRIERATEEDTPLILSFIHELAQYERALDRVSATEESLRVTLFGPTLCVNVSETPTAH